MKQIQTIFSVLLLVAFAMLTSVNSISAQGGTDNDGFLVKITGGATFSKGDCGYGTATWGGDVLEDACVNLVWAYDPTPTGDSLCCDSITNNYTDKWVMIRRGVCEFGRKSLWAEFAGAKGVIILNHYNTAADNACTAPGLGAGAVGGQVTIPVFSASRGMGEALDAAVKAGGGQAEICFILPRLLEATDAYHFYTPVTQVSALDNMTVRMVNRGPAATNVTVKADVVAPDGSVSSVSTVLDAISAAADTVISLPSFTPAAVEGVFNVYFSNSVFTESRDTVRSKFVHTPYSFGTDIGVLDAGGVGPTDAQFALANFSIQNAGLCLTGANGGVATHATFGISNKAAVVTADPAANVIGVTLYDADADDDGVIDLGSAFTDLDNGIVATGELIMDTLLVDDQLVSVELTDVLTGNPGHTLKANHPYYIALSYDGLAAGTGVCVRYVNTLDKRYLNFPTTPLRIDQLYSGWAGAMVVQRLELEGYTPPPNFNIVKTNAPLADSKFSITPNPAIDHVMLTMNLAGVNGKVAVSLMDYNGRIVETKVVKNFRDGQFRFETANLPSGTYMMWIRTAEGNVMKPVAICH